jgi:hypothetical protein
VGELLLELDELEDELLLVEDDEELVELLELLVELDEELEELELLLKVACSILMPNRSTALFRLSFATLRVSLNCSNVLPSKFSPSCRECENADM